MASSGLSCRHRPAPRDALVRIAAARVEPFAADNHIGKPPWRRLGTDAPTVRDRPSEKPEAGRERSPQFAPIRSGAAVKRSFVHRGREQLIVSRAHENLHLSLKLGEHNGDTCHRSDHWRTEVERTEHE
jgi:hypothetical protein